MNLEALAYLSAFLGLGYIYWAVRERWSVVLPDGTTRLYESKKEAYRKAFYEAAYSGSGEVRLEGKTFRVSPK